MVVDSQGQLELAELRRGLPIVLARSRVELEPAAAVRPRVLPSDRARGPLPAWKGEFEPIGFPFGCGRLDFLERSDGALVRFNRSTSTKAANGSWRSATIVCSFTLPA